MRKREFLTSSLAMMGFVALPAYAQKPAGDARAVVIHYAELVAATYADVLAAALDMQRIIADFVKEPSAAGLTQARQAWLDAREWYGQSEAFRFYGGPVDDEKGPEGRLNSWPLDEAYIDYVKGKPNAGIVNNPKIAITKASLARLNERGGEENIACGWHAVEFMLWGQDFSETGPGERPFTDYVDGKAPNAARRRQYLTVVTEMLVDDLRFLVKAWTPNVRNYREAFEKGGLESVRLMIVGLGSLSRGELVGERMEVAMNTQDQEDEQSCFSDNTHRDIVNNALGIENVWLGRFRRRDGSLLEGPSLRQLAESADAALARRVTAQIAASLAAAQTIQAPFDREIIGGKDAPGRLRLQKTIDSVIQQSKDFVDVASALGITRLTIKTK